MLSFLAFGARFLLGAYRRLSSLFPDFALALGSHMRGDPEVPECALGAHGAQCTPQSPGLGGGTNANEALAGGHESD